MRGSIFVIFAILAVASSERHARVYMSGKTGVSGMVDLMQMNGGLLMDGQLNGLTPGKHGFHVHEWGDIFSKGCDSAGGHFNPRKMQHGGLNDAIRHLGDLGNIEADQSGHVGIHLFAKDLYLSGPESIVGRAFVLHSKEDDLGRGSNPESKINGNSGVRVACGVVVLVP